MTADLNAILKLDVPVIVRLGERMMPCEDIIAWIPGSIIELDKDAEDELDLLINNVPIAQGNAVKVGENFGIQITFVGDLKAKIEAMAENHPQIAQSTEESEITDSEADDLASQLLAGQL